MTTHVRSYILLIKKNKSSYKRCFMFVQLALYSSTFVSLPCLSQCLNSLIKNNNIHYALYRFP